MRVTIISDASVCPKQHVGGYGFWAVSDRGSHAGDGVFKGVVVASDEAEMKAVVNALHSAIAVGVAAAGDQVLIQTDSQTAVLGFQGRCHLGKNKLPIIAAFESLRAKYSLTIEFRHVKGHSPQEGARFKAQRKSDLRARKAMRRARATKRKPA